MATIAIEWFEVEGRWLVSKAAHRVTIFDKRARPPRVVATVANMDAARRYLGDLINPPKKVWNQPDQTPARGPYRGNDGDDRTFDVNEYLFNVATRSR